MFGAAPVQAQSVPIIVPPISAIVVGIPPSAPSLVVGFPGDSGVNSRAGLTWSTTGRADVDVDVDINRQHGQAAAARTGSRRPQALGPVPFTEELQELILGAWVQIVLGQRAHDADRRAHLVEIAPAALADLEVGVKSFPIGIGSAPSR